VKIIGCDLHARQQTLAILDPATGEVVRTTLQHEGNKVREFYSSLVQPVRVGIEATGSMQWFVNLMEELGIERENSSGWSLFPVCIRNPFNASMGIVTERGKVIHPGNRLSRIHDFLESRYDESKPVRPNQNRLVIFFMCAVFSPR